MPTGLRADYVVTGDGATLAPGWLVHDAGRIVAVGGGEPPTGAAFAAAPRGAAVVPGFVDAHAHLALGAFRGVADDSPFLDWIHRGLLPEFERRKSEPEIFVRGAEHSVDLLLRGGVTAVGDHFFRLEGAAALRRRGLRGVHFHEVFGSQAPDEDAYWAQAESELSGLDAALDGFPWGLSPHTPWTCPRRTFERAAAKARAEGRRLSFHLSESAEEQAMFAERRGPLYDAYARQGRLDRYALGATPAATLEALGALGPRTLVAHAVHLAPDDVGILARTGTHVAHCPSSNLKLAEGVAPVAALLAAGVNVALGTDSAASSARLDMFEEMRLAMFLGRGATGTVGPFRAATALRMATLAGARALGLEDEIGTLAPGKRADFAVVDLSQPRHGPVKDPVQTLVWACDAADVSSTTIDGRERYARSDVR
ncbi:MAG TPA: amidohydrolase family protein [Planctomycetota bacterium]|nr:amidohydrolase family protein [Planctomycetota bacterium]